MACSNNVVRAGLTPKAIDKETLIDMLTYEFTQDVELIFRCGPVRVLHPISVDDHYATIQTDAKEFMIEVITLKKGESYSIPCISIPRILIGYSGCGKVGDMNVK